MKYILALLFIFFLCSCTIEKKNTSIIKEFDEVLNLVSDIYNPPGELLSPRSMFITNNQLVIYKEQQEKLFDVYELPDLKFLYSYGTIGEGPDEFTLLDARSFHTTKDGFEVLETGTHTLKTIQVNSQGMHIIKSEKLFDDYMPTNGFYPLKNNMYLSFGNIGELNEYVLFNKSTQTFQSFGEYPTWSKINSDEPFKLFITYLKFCVVHPDGSKFASFYCRFKRLQIFDNNGTLLHDIDVQIEPYTINIEEKTSDQYEYYATPPKALGNRIYAICFNSRLSQQENTPTHELHIWDWKGNFLSCYKLDKKITYFAICEKYKKIYGINYEKENEIYIYDLPE